MPCYSYSYLVSSIAMISLFLKKTDGQSLRDKKNQPILWQLVNKYLNFKRICPCIEETCNNWYTGCSSETVRFRLRLADCGGPWEWGLDLGLLYKWKFSLNIIVSNHGSWSNAQRAFAWKGILYWIVVLALNVYSIEGLTYPWGILCHLSRYQPLVQKFWSHY